MTTADVPFDVDWIRALVCAQGAFAVALGMTFIYFQSVHWRRIKGAGFTMRVLTALAVAILVLNTVVGAEIVGRWDQPLSYRTLAGFFGFGCEDYALMEIVKFAYNREKMWHEAEEAAKEKTNKTL